MPKINDRVTRVDFRCPSDLYEAIEALASANGNRVNHKTGRPELTPTILDLLKRGLASLDTGEESNLISDIQTKKSARSGSSDDVTIERLTERIESLERVVETGIVGTQTDLSNARFDAIEAQLKETATRDELEEMGRAFNDAIGKVGQRVSTVAQVVNDELSFKATMNEITHPTPSDTPDLVLQKLYAVVRLTDGKIEGFYNGTKFVDDPTALKIYRSQPNDRTMESLRLKALGTGQQVKWNDLFTLINLMGYPYGYRKWATKDIAEKWRQANIELCASPGR